MNTPFYDYAVLAVKKRAIQERLAQINSLIENETVWNVLKGAVDYEFLKAEYDVWENLMDQIDGIDKDMEEIAYSIRATELFYYSIVVDKYLLNIRVTGSDAIVYDTIELDEVHKCLP